ncbi:MAG: NADH-quinone oxidoreductase subunit L [Bdellovibrionales bacterium]|nr:NADH-quinone oxidoreductase subunit L [Bdellovibrionales bacterium]
MPTSTLFALLLLAPLFGFLFNGARFRSRDYLSAGSVASIAVLVSFVCACFLVFQLLGLPLEQRVLRVQFFEWLSLGEFKVQAGFLIDQVSAIMVLVITGVGFLIHVFSVGYMSHDERPAKYFAYLNFFLFNMLLLVLGDNLLVMFVGWEGVGLCSYLLIGFWFRDSEKAAAGMKAFITNRIGDAGFLLGIFLIFATFGTVNFTQLISRLPEIAEVGWTGPITLACLFLFIGATGKSAQIPLYVWLPDAMAGPTPVSALIHAATMVTAGVYMMVRLSSLYVLAPSAMLVVAIVGALTAFFAATIGMTQWDIKKVLAYSTVSQLGYMVLAVGVGAFGPAMFHLMTHAFFKALMFLGSGSVIHSMHGEQDMRKMGGLRNHMPITYWTFMVGWLAIIGIPPFAGFFSKDEILWRAFNFPQVGPLFWLMGLLGAAVTAFYMTRLMALVFWGKERFGTQVHPHESPLSMTLPLFVLGFFSIVGGWVGIPHILSEVLPGHLPNFLEHWLEPLMAKMPHPIHGSSVLEWSLMGISVGIAGLAAWFAYDTYLLHPDRPARITKKIAPLYGLVAAKYRVDEFYFEKFIHPLVNLSKGLWVYIDANFIDRITYWVGDFVKSSGSGIRSIQNGNLQQYALLIAIGLISLMIFAL